MSRSTKVSVDGADLHVDGLGAMADSVGAAGIDVLAGAFEQLVFAAKTRSDRPELLARFAGRRPLHEPRGTRRRQRPPGQPVRP